MTIFNNTRDVQEYIDLLISGIEYDVNDEFIEKNSLEWIDFTSVDDLNKLLNIGEHSYARSDVKKLISLIEFKETICDYNSDWEYGTNIFNDYNKHEYFVELLNETGDIEKLPSYIVIDWDATIKNLIQDYSAISFEDETYYVRST